MNSTKYETVSVSDITTLKDGYIVYLGYWWVINKENEVLFYIVGGAHIPQCNKHENVAKRILKKIYKDYKVEFIPIAYIKPEFVYPI